jgi:cell division protein ZapA
MGQVSVTLNDRIYRLVCGDGEEDRLVELAAYVKSKVEQLRADLGHVGDERLVLMAALTIADELFDARAAGAATNPTSAEREFAVPAKSAAGKNEPQVEQRPMAAPQPAEPDHIQQLKAVAARMAAERDGAQKPAPLTVASPKPRRRDVA